MITFDYDYVLQGMDTMHIDRKYIRDKNHECNGQIETLRLINLRLNGSQCQIIEDETCIQLLNLHNSLKNLTIDVSLLGMGMVVLIGASLNGKRLSQIY